MLDQCARLPIELRCSTSRIGHGNRNGRVGLCLLLGAGICPSFLSVLQPSLTSSSFYFRKCFCLRCEFSGRATYRVSAECRQADVNQTIPQMYHLTLCHEGKVRVPPQRFGEKLPSPREFGFHVGPNKHIAEIFKLEIRSRFSISWDCYVCWRFALSLSPRPTLSHALSLVSQLLTIRIGKK